MLIGRIGMHSQEGRRTPYPIPWELSAVQGGGRSLAGPQGPVLSQDRALRLLAIGRGARRDAHAGRVRQWACELHPGHVRPSRTLIASRPGPQADLAGPQGYSDSNMRLLDILPRLKAGDSSYHADGSSR